METTTFIKGKHGMRLQAHLPPMALWLMASGCVLASEKLYLDISDALANGKRLWLANCESCHGYGIAGAPVPMKASNWEQRVIKPRQQLYNHAINVFFGPDDTYMPARGGNDALTDNEVELAVDYMAPLAPQQPVHREMMINFGRQHCAGCYCSGMVPTV